MARTVSVDTEALLMIKAFQGLSAEALAWLQHVGELRQYADGETTVEEGSPADTLWGVVEGSVHNRQQGPNAGLSLFLEAGEVGGVLPYSRLEFFPARGVAVGDTVLYLLPRSQFAALEQVSPELVQRLVAIMNNRVRDEARSLERDDKLRALGKLAAGLSHELNNPATAISRAAAAQATALHEVPGLLRHLLTAGLSAEAVTSLLALAERPVDITSQLTGLQAADREEELADWLETQDCPDGYALAVGLLDAGLTPATLAPVAAQLPPSQRPPALQWLSGYLAVRRLNHDIGEASRRISALVGDVKTYAHMDRASAREPMLVTTGLDSTLNMLAFELRQKNVRLSRDYALDLPPILGQVSSLNQVWTNLFDNALYALPASDGELVIRVWVQGKCLFVSIRDNGTGMTPEVLAHLFEPFYTTKPPGEGTGQGLDIARRIVLQHGGQLNVTSEPGRTEFTTCLPVA